jgi:hypothetical protein
MAALPYVTATGNVDKALRGIKAAATPETVSQDFVKTILGIQGGSGNQMTAYLKKIGFASSDGKPTDIYRKFRNEATQGWAAAEALKIGYAPLYVRNEYVHRLNDAALRGLIVEETGAEQDSNIVTMTVGCIKHLKNFAKWDAAPQEDKTDKSPIALPPALGPGNPQFEKAALGARTQSLGLNLGYTINLNLPATSDPAVFNAIFHALKEHLLKGSNG